MIVDHEHEVYGLAPNAAALVAVVQELSLARELETIMRIVRLAARELSGANGASFILRDGDCCYYADESAIAPLWKGRMFPMSTCISGWVMLHGEAVAIEDIYQDSRIPADVYAPTFVKSLAMVPIRRRAPIGAIGTYWSSRHRIGASELTLLQALADSTAVAMENLAIYAELETRVRQRTIELESANRELAVKHEALVEVERQREALSELVVHDLKSPAGAIMLAASLRLERSAPGDPARRDWSRVFSSAEQIHRTALNLLDVAASQEGKLVPRPSEVDVAALFGEVSELFAPQVERSSKTLELDADLPNRVVHADRELLRRVLQNLVDNAVRHTPANGTVRLEAHAVLDGSVEFAVSDHGSGIPLELRERIFAPHAFREGCTSGICHGLGLTFCRLAVDAHGGRIWVEENAPHGSRFCFVLPAA